MSTPKDILIPFPRTCEYVTLHDKGDMYEAMGLELAEIILGDLDGSIVITGVLRRGK